MIGEITPSDWLIRASDVDAVLDAPCLGVSGGLGRYDPVLDDASGDTVLVERGTDRLWIRDAGGTVSDRCWWLPAGGATGAGLPAQGCSPDGRQRGVCGPEAAHPEGWRFFTPGVALAPAPIQGAAAVDGTVLVVARGALERLDLLPSADPAVDPGDALATWRSWLPPLPEGGGGLSGVAAGDTLVALSDRRGVSLFPRAGAGSGPSPEIEQIRGESAHLAASGRFVAAVVGGGVEIAVFGAGLSRERWKYPNLDDIAQDAVVDPASGTVWILADDAVIRLGPDGDVGAGPAPGAEG